MKKLLFLIFLVGSALPGISQTPNLRQISCYSLEAVAKNGTIVKGELTFVLEYEIASNIWAKMQTIKSKTSKVIFDNINKAGVYRASQINPFSKNVIVQYKAIKTLPSEILYSNSILMKPSNNCIGLISEPINKSSSIDIYSIFPNPTSSEINIHSSNELDFFAEIYNVSGKLVSKTDKSQNNLRLGSKNLTSGIYFIKIIDTNGLSHIKKLIIEN